MRAFVKAPIVAVFAIVLLAYQNCSDVSFEPEDPNASLNCVLVEGDCFLGGTKEEVAGAQNLPPLKMVFVVDNSFTMYFNQVKFKEAFTKMFESSNSDNLTQFDTTAYLINTSQYNYLDGDNDLLDLQETMIPSVDSRCLCCSI